MEEVKNCKIAGSRTKYAVNHETVFQILNCKFYTRIYNKVLDNRRRNLICENSEEISEKVLSFNHQI